MKFYLQISIILILWINFSCVNSKTIKASNCPNELLSYYNYDNVEVLNKIRFISNLKKIDNETLNFYLKNGVDFHEIKQNQIIFLPRSEFYNSSDLKGEIPIFILGYTQGSYSKQYLALDANLGQNSSLYLINEKGDKITSTFLAHSNYNSGFGNQSIESKKLQENIYQIEIYNTSDRRDNDGKFSNKCYSQFKISNSGHVIVSKE